MIGVWVSRLFVAVLALAAIAATEAHVPSGCEEHGYGSELCNAMVLLQWRADFRVSVSRRRKHSSEEQLVDDADAAEETSEERVTEDESTVDSEACVDVEPHVHKDWKYNTCAEQYEHTDKCERRRNETLTDGFCKKTCGLCDRGENASSAGNISSGRTASSETANVSSGRNVSEVKCQKLAYLRIQKTGSTTLGESIMPTLCEANKQKCAYFEHLDYAQAVDFAGNPECVITMLRDPVERFLSEFAMARSPDGIWQEAAQWDWRREDLDILRRLSARGNNATADAGIALLEYLREPKNPSRNRQTMYLLGFQRVGSGRNSFPAMQYDWDKDGESLLAEAKSHLSGLLAFGITDCYVDSVVALADATGWDSDVAKAMATNVHSRQQDKLATLNQMANSSDHQIFASTKTPAEMERILGLPMADQYYGPDEELTESFHDLFHAQVSSAYSWRALLKEMRIEPELEREILEVNSIDAQLVEWAKQEYYDRYHKHCSGS